MGSRVLVVVVGVALGASSAVTADVFCKTSKGAMMVRAACKPREVRVDPVALGLQGPPGPQGLVGPTGPQGPQGTCSCPATTTTTSTTTTTLPNGLSCRPDSDVIWTITGAMNAPPSGDTIFLHQPGDSSLPCRLPMNHLVPGSSTSPTGECAIGGLTATFTFVVFDVLPGSRDEVQVQLSDDLVAGCTCRILYLPPGGGVYAT